MLGYAASSLRARLPGVSERAFINTHFDVDGGHQSEGSTTPPTPPTAVTYAADVVNQYTTIGGVTRGHDNNGNLKDDGTHLFGYDFENRLVEVKLKSTSALVATYTYDALGRRVEKVVAAGSTTRFLLDGVQVVEEYDGSGAWQARYLYEDGIDRPRAMDRADVADVNGNANTAEVLRFHYHQQALGSVTEISQPTGAVIEWVTYDVYGAATIRDRLGATVASSAVGNPWLFTGRAFDPESGLYHYRARAYDASAGRFLQRDPLGTVDGLSLRSYAHCSPGRYTDSHGTDDDTRDPPGPLEKGYSPSDAEDKRWEMEEVKANVRRARVVIRCYGPAWARTLLESKPYISVTAMYSAGAIASVSPQTFTTSGGDKRGYLLKVRVHEGLAIHGWIDLLAAILHELRHVALDQDGEQTWEVKKPDNWGEMTKEEQAEWLAAVEAKKHPVDGTPGMEGGESQGAENTENWKKVEQDEAMKTAAEAEKNGYPVPWTKGSPGQRAEQRPSKDNGGSRRV